MNKEVRSTISFSIGCDFCTNRNIERCKLVGPSAPKQHQFEYIVNSFLLIVSPFIICFLKQNVLSFRRRIVSHQRPTKQTKCDKHFDKNRSKISKLNCCVLFQHKFIDTNNALIIANIIKMLLLSKWPSFRLYLV